MKAYRVMIRLLGVIQALGCFGPSAVEDPMLVVEGGGVFLPEVAEGDRAATSLVLRNAGNGPLTLHEADLVAPPSWRAIGWPAMPVRLAPGARMGLRLAYAPARGQGDGAVWIESDDFARPRVYVPLGGLRPLPSVEPTAEEVDFGKVATGELARYRLRVANGGGGTLTVRGVALGARSSGDFSFDAEAVGELPPGEWFEVVVTYRPTDGGADHGALLVETDDPRRPRLSVSLRGEQDLPPLR